MNKSAESSSGGNQPLAEVLKGSSPTLLHASKANELIRAINGLRNIRVLPDGFCKVWLTDNNLVLEFDVDLLRSATEVEVSGNLNGAPATGTALFTVEPTPI